MRTDLAIKAMTRRWLGQRGINAISAEEANGQMYLVIMTTDGRWPLGLPRVYMGFPVAVIRGGPFQAERSGPWSTMSRSDEAAVLNPAKETGEALAWYQDPTYKKLLLGAAVLRLVASPVAMAVSYKRNQSVLWVLVQGLLFPVPFLIYNFISPSPRKA